MNIALIPLRGGSKSIPEKNIKPIAGKPLCAWAIEAARTARVFSRVVVSTDSDKIAGVVSRIDTGVDIINRPAKLATDTASTESVMLHTATLYPFDVITTVQATSPLVTSEDFNAAVKRFFTGGYDSMLSAVKTYKFFWTPYGRPLNYNPNSRPMRQEFGGCYQENGSFYITARWVLEKLKCRVGGKVGVYEMPQDAGVELDSPEDWPVVERKLKERLV